MAPVPAGPQAAPPAAGSGIGRPAGERCSPLTSCGASACSVAGARGTDVLNTLSCPQACCTASGACGLALAATSEAAAVQRTECIALDQPGRETPACPSYFDAFAVGSANLQPVERENLADNNFRGCCRPDAVCGFMVVAYGLGCVSVYEMPKLTAVFPFISELAPRSCVPAPP